MTEEQFKQVFNRADQPHDNLLGFDEYKQSLKLIEWRVELNKKLEDPEFKEFFDADNTIPNHDELITFLDWKALAMKITPRATDKQLKKDFEKADVDPTDGVLSFDEYKQSKQLLEKRKELNEKLPKYINDK